MKRCAAFILLPLLAVFAAQAGATNLIQNGDFHTGDFTDWTLGLTPNGSAGPWGPGVEGCEGHMDQLCWDGRVATLVDNGQYAGATMSQTFTSGAGPATLSMFYEVQMLFDGAEGGDFRLLLDGNIVAQYDTGELSPWQFVEGTLAANANLTAGQHTLEIDVLNNQQWGDYTSPIELVGGIDVEGPVPEPGSLVLMGSGALGLVGVLRRKIF
jgi:hypothetical protein